MPPMEINVPANTIYMPIGPRITLKASCTGAFVLARSDPKTPIDTASMAIYRIDTSSIHMIMARGKFFLGFFISSAAIAITSNPV